MAKEVNYTDEQVAEMKAQYKDASTPETVAALAVKFGKSTRSVIAKLSRERVYVAKLRVTKQGEPVVSKADLVKNIERALDIEAATLVKAGKQDLKKLSDIISELTGFADEDEVQSFSKGAT
jgi:hypothetical protein